jgi:hypothetical protein
MNVSSSDCLMPISASHISRLSQGQEVDALRAYPIALSCHQSKVWFLFLNCLPVKCAVKCAASVNNLKKMNLYFVNVNSWRHNNHYTIARSMSSDIFISICIVIKACLHAKPYLNFCSVHEVYT